MFLERLNQILRRIEGALAVSLVDRDGIAVESVSSDPDLDLELLGAELVNQLQTISDHHRELSPTPVQRLTVGSDERTLMVGSLNQDYYLLLVLGADAIAGRASFELRRAGLLLGNDL